MRVFKLLFSSSLLLSFCFNACASKTKTCNFFLIKEQNNEVVIDKVILQENETKVIKDEGIISYIMVFNPGSKSGEVIKKEDRATAIIATFSNEVVKVSILRNDGSQKQMPDIDVKQALEQNARLNITGANGYKKAYLIENYKTVNEDYGPIIDVFAGKFPLNNGDYSLLSESLEGKIKNVIVGKAPYKIVRDWVTVDCLLPNGEIGCFVVDFGATSSVMAEEHLPENIEIQTFKIVEYSDNGVKESNAIVAGATGMVDNILGKANFPEISFGDISLKDIGITIVKNFPEVFKEFNIMGIIGMDMLRNTDVIYLNNLNKDTKHEIIFAAKNSKFNNASYAIPYSLAGGHLFIEGSIQGEAISFLLDTGAGKSGIGNTYVKNKKISYDIISDNKNILIGLDGIGSEYKIVKIKDIRIKELKIKELEFLLSDTFIFSNMGLQNDGALLGMNFLYQYNKVAFDLKSNELLIWK